MIYYNRRLWTVFLSAPLRTQINVFRVPMCIALLSTVLSLVSIVLLWRFPGAKAFMNNDGNAYGAFSTLVGFLIVFRTSQAFARFCEGTSLIHGMMGDWFNAASTLIAFLQTSPDGDAALYHTQLIIRLVSLLNAMILGELEGKDIWNWQAHEYDLLDTNSLDPECLRLLSQMDVCNRPEVVTQWIQCLTVQMVHTGVLSTPAPLLTRVFQDIADGIAKYHAALKFPNVPVPYPYVATTEVLLYLHAIITPIILSQWAAVVAVPFYNFVLVFIVWSLYLVAGELDNPFEGTDMNDLDMKLLQTQINGQLLALARGPSLILPKLCVDGREAANHLNAQAQGTSVTGSHSAGTCVKRTLLRSRTTWRGQASASEATSIPREPRVSVQSVASATTEASHCSAAPERRRAWRLLLGRRHAPVFQKSVSTLSLASTPRPVRTSVGAKKLTWLHNDVDSEERSSDLEEERPPHQPQETSWQCEEAVIVESPELEESAIAMTDDFDI